jgi:hypothetical protein
MGVVFLHRPPLLNPRGGLRPREVPTGAREKPEAFRSIGSACSSRQAAPHGPVRNLPWAEATFYQNHNQKKEPMKNTCYSLLIGLIAGTIDVIPMILQGLCWHANSSAFVFWIVMGIIIPNIHWNFPGWRKGLIISEMSALPIMILVAKSDVKAVIPIFIMTAILGSFVGYCSNRFIKMHNEVATPDANSGRW